MHAQHLFIEDFLVYRGFSCDPTNYESRLHPSEHLHIAVLTKTRSLFTPETDYPLDNSRQTDI